MKEFKVLKILDLFQRIFVKLGVDYQVMRRILQVKLTMDGRRAPTITLNTKKSGKEINNSFIKSLWVYALMGMINVFFILLSKNYIFQMSFVFGIMIFMMMTSLIADFSSVLLDVKDKNIILSRPVNSMTLNMAKVIHIVIYLFFITTALMGPALIASILRYGILFFLIFFIEVILINLFIVTLTVLLYLGILRIFDGEKLKDIINYVQIGLSMMMAIGYQLIVRLFSFSGFNITFEPRWWQYFIAPIWFGAPFEVLLNGNVNLHYILFSILALVVPIVSICLYIKFSPVFERNLQKLSMQTSKNKRKTDRILYGLSRIICSTKEERTFFHFTYKMIKNEREFKLHVYPHLGFALIFPFIFIVTQIVDEGFGSLASGNMHFNIYLCTLFLPMVLFMMQYSSDYKGAWIYKVMPISGLTPVYKGCFKAFFVYLMVPVYLFESTLFTFIFGIRILPDLIVVFLNMFIFSLLCFKSLLKEQLPFSKPFSGMQDNNKWSSVGLMGVLGILWGIHFFSRRFSFSIAIYITVVLIINVILWKKTFKISCKEPLGDVNDGI